MVQDNLLTYGADYKRVASLSMSRGTDNFKLLPHTVISLAVVALVNYQERRVTQVLSSRGEMRADANVPLN